MTSVGYDSSHFTSTLAAEDRHFWYRARNEFIAEALRPIAQRVPPGAHVVELGCGNGNVLRVLSKLFPAATVVGMDAFMEGLVTARRRSGRSAVQARIDAAPFRPGLHLVGLFDVLEHLPDDRRVLHDVASMVLPGGILAATVPAHAALWSAFDEASHHYRRYESGQLHERVTAAGFSVEYLSPFMSALYPVMRMTRRRTSRSSRMATERDVVDNELRVPRALNALLYGLLREEARLARRWHGLPMGTSLLVVATRDGTRR